MDPEPYSFVRFSVTLGALFFRLWTCKPAKGLCQVTPILSVYGLFCVCFSRVGSFNCAIFLQVAKCDISSFFLLPFLSVYVRVCVSTSKRSWKSALGMLGDALLLSCIAPALLKLRDRI